MNSCSDLRNPEWNKPEVLRRKPLRAYHPHKSSTREGTLPPEPPKLRAGHEWHERDRVAEYITRTDRQAADRAEAFRLMARLILQDVTSPLSVLDIGSGHGVAVAGILDRFPNATAIGLDISEAMMAEGARRMERFGDRFRYVVGDFADGVLPVELSGEGQFDAVVSARAIHHLPGPLMATLYSTIYDRLAPGGCFFNLDTADPESFILDTVYRSAGTDREKDSGRRRTEEDFNRRKVETYRDAPLRAHLDWLESAGFQAVDCFWKNLSLALIGGYKSVI